MDRGRHCFENPASTLTRMGRLGGEGGGPLNDILQRNWTLHALLKSLLVSRNKSIFIGDRQAVDDTPTDSEEMYLQNMCFGNVLRIFGNVFVFFSLFRMQLCFPFRFSVNVNALRRLLLSQPTPYLNVCILF